MMGIIRSEWFKVRRRRMTWILIAISPAVMVVFYSLMAVSIASAAQEPEDIAAWEARLSVANLVTFGDAIVYRVVALLAVILAGSMTANEFGWRTILTFATWTGDRRKLLLGKLAGTGIVTAGLIAITWAAVAASVITLTVVDSRFGAGEVTPSIAAELARGFAVTWLAAMVYAVMATAVAIWTRSAAAAIAIPLGVLLLEPLGAAGLRAMGGVTGHAINFTLSYNIDGLLAADGAIHGVEDDLSAYPSPLQAMLFLGGFTAITALLALRILARRDISE